MNLPFDSIIHLLHDSAYGSLATQSTQFPGYPFSSILPFAPDEYHRPVCLISRLAEHTKNLLADARASLLVHAVEGHHVLASERVSLLGEVVHIDASQELIARYLRYQPDAAQYLSLGGFSFFVLSPKGARYVAGFGKMGWAEQAAWRNAAVLSLKDEAELLRQLEARLPSGVRLLGLDSYGFDIVQDGLRQRHRFQHGLLPVDKIEQAVGHILASHEQT